MGEVVRNLIILAVFVILAAGSIVNNIRHHKETKDEREAKRAEKRAARETKIRKLLGIFKK